MMRPADRSGHLERTGKVGPCGAESLFAGTGGNMNKQELIERMADKTGLTKKDCGAALDSLLSTVAEALQESKPVKLSGFGRFEAKHRAARTGRNLQTREPVKYPGADPSPRSKRERA